MIATSVINSAEEGMKGAIKAFMSELSKVRTGRANSALLEGVKVDYYGSESLLKNVAAITVVDAHTIIVSPWQKDQVKMIEKAITKAELGLNPISEADLVRIVIPPLTSERRQELTKIVNKMSEQAKIEVRGARHNALDQLKTMVKAKEVDEDTDRRTKDALQKLTDQYIQQIEQITTTKQQDLVKV